MNAPSSRLMMSNEWSVPRWSCHISIGATGSPCASIGTIDEYWLHTDIATTSAAASGCAVVTSCTALTSWSHIASASCVAVSGPRSIGSARWAAPITVASSRTSATFRLVVPTSTPERTA